MRLAYSSSSAAAAPPGASDQPPARKHSRGVKTSQEEKEIQQMQELLNNVSKLALSSALTGRVLKAVVIKCVKIPTSSQWVTIHKDARAKFIEDQQKAKAEGVPADKHKKSCGIPSVWGTNAWIEHLIKLLKTELEQMEKDQPDHGDTAALKAKIELIEKSTEKWTWQMVHEDIPHSVVSKMFHSTEKRVEISMPMAMPVAAQPQMFMMEGGLLRPIHVMLLAFSKMMTEGEEMQGIAPAGDLERKIQAALDAMKE